MRQHPECGMDGDAQCSMLVGSCWRFVADTWLQQSATDVFGNTLTVILQVRATAVPADVIEPSNVQVVRLYGCIGVAQPAVMVALNSILLPVIQNVVGLDHVACFGIRGSLKNRHQHLSLVPTQAYVFAVPSTGFGQHRTSNLEHHTDVLPRLPQLSSVLDNIPFLDDADKTMIKSIVLDTSQNPTAPEIYLFHFRCAVPVLTLVTAARLAAAAYEDCELEDWPLE